MQHPPLIEDEIQFINDLCASVNTHIEDKSINIIFVCAGTALLEREMCNNLITNYGFIINSVFLHDVLYNNNAGIQEQIQEEFIGIASNVYFSDIITDIETKSERDDIGQKKNKRVRIPTICIACRPQIIGGVAGKRDLHNFISKLFAKITHYIFLIVSNYFYLYTKEEHEFRLLNPPPIVAPIIIPPIPNYVAFMSRVDEIDGLLQNGMPVVGWGIITRRRRKNKTHRRKPRRINHKKTKTKTKSNRYRKTS
jgi:hypothetical protein